MDSALREILAEVRELELVARRNVSSLYAGNYLTTIPGRGLEFHEARRYVQGEPVRRIDWKMTARMGVPYVRTFLEERQREIWIALDVSPSMATGWQDRTKLEMAVEMAATLAVSAIAAGDRLGFVTFSDRVWDLDRPRAGKRQLFRALKALVTSLERPSTPCRESDPRCAIHAIQRFQGRRFVVFVISDFIDHDVPEDLKYLKRRHDVSLIHLYDPLEYDAFALLRSDDAFAPLRGDDALGPLHRAEGSAPVQLTAFAPEGAGALTSLTPGEIGSLEEMTAFLERECDKYAVDFGSYPTTAPVGGALTELFQRKRRRLGR